MAKTRKGRKARSIDPIEEYYKTPRVSRVLQGKYSSYESLIFLLVDGFGVDGCGMTNAELARQFNRSGNTIRRAITRLWRGGEFKVTGREGQGRKIYAARHPEVLEKFKDLSIDRRQSSDV
ncbi:hypothetical protein LCGC14_1088830 [marine sediment metagenome]|uniref:Uncharacterized protein n=1 Tax=marine sediment metagenome TaxID=412755 RepID=A0A0F9N0R3_9ZZZZ